jgi:hypothetical protein
MQRRTIDDIAYVARRISRRRLVSVTNNPTAEWMARDEHRERSQNEHGNQAALATNVSVTVPLAQGD